MSVALKIGDQVIPAEQIPTLLAGYQLLPQLAAEILIDQKIAGIACTAEEREQALQNFWQRHNLGQPGALESWMQRFGLTPDQLEALALRDLKIAKFKEDTWGAQVSSDFLQKKASLDRVIYSMICTQEIGIAQELYFRIQEGEQSFADLARTYSQGPEAETGGLVGPVELQKIHPILANTFAKGKPGQLFPPMQVGNWLVVARLERVIPAQLDEGMRQRLLQECFTDWLQAQLQKQAIAGYVLAPDDLRREHDPQHNHAAAVPLMQVGLEP